MVVVDSLMVGVKSQVYVLGTILYYYFCDGRFDDNEHCYGRCDDNLVQSLDQLSEFSFLFLLSIRYE